jgi:hypothetical protein
MTDVWDGRKQKFSLKFEGNFCENALNIESLSLSLRLKGEVFWKFGSGKFGGSKKKTDDR